MFDQCLHDLRQTRHPHVNDQRAGKTRESIPIEDTSRFGTLLVAGDESDGAGMQAVGEGNAGTSGAPSGDLYITVRVDPHPVFERDGDNIRIKVPISVSEAGLGAKIEVPTIDGRALLKIPHTCYIILKNIILQGMPQKLFMKLNSLVPLVCVTLCFAFRILKP